MGVRRVACKSCLDQFGLTEQVATGEVVGMDTIVSLLMQTESVITP